MTPVAERDDRVTDEAQSLGVLDRYQPLILIGSIAVGLGLAKIAPDVADRMLALVSVGVFALIYLVMLGVDLSGVLAAFTNRRFLATAAVINFGVNPLIAWALGTTFLGAEPDLRVGLILFLVTPCIGWYLIFTELAGGDARLGVSLLAINVTLQVLLLPLYLYVLAGTSVGVDIFAIARSIALYLLAPLLLAAVTRRIVSSSPTRLDEIELSVRLPYVKTGLLVLVIVAMFASQAEEVFDNPSVVVKLVIPFAAFFAISFCIAIVVGRALHLPYEETALLVFTTTSRNSEASLAIAATAFASPLVSLTVVMGPAIELPLLVLMVRVLIHLRPRLQSKHLSTATAQPARTPTPAPVTEQVTRR